MQPKHRRRSALLLSAIAAAALLVACSSGATGPSGAPETSASVVPASSTASEPSGPSANADAPEGWLPGLPVPTGAEIITMAALDDKNITSIWRSAAAPEEAGAAYGAQLAEAGIVSLVTVASDGMTTTDYAGGGFTVNVVTTGEGGATGLLINASRE